MTDSSKDKDLLESEASQVLQRATEIEARSGPEVSVADLRAAALEAGIPAEAFDRALAELHGTSLQQSPDSQLADSGTLVTAKSRLSGVSAPVRRAALATLGAGLGWLAHALSAFFLVDPNVTIQFSLIVAFFSACGLVVTRRSDRDVIGFGFDLAALWVGLTLVLMLFDPTDAGAMLSQMGLIGGIAAVVGSWLVAKLPTRAPQLYLPDFSPSGVSEDPAG